MTIRAQLLLGLLLFLMPLFLRAQEKVALDDTDTQSSIKASYLFQFSKYTDWPEETKQGDFVIGIAGNPSLYGILVDKYANKAIGSQLLRIIELEGTEKDLQDVQILYLDSKLANALPNYVKSYRKKPTLIVTELSSALELGAHINFLKTEGIIRFEINDTRSQESGISFSDKLKGWAIKLK